MKKAKSKKETGKSNDLPLSNEERLVKVAIQGELDPNMRQAFGDCVFTFSIVGNTSSVSLQECVASGNENGSFSHPIFSDRCSLSLESLRRLFEPDKHYVSLGKPILDPNSSAVSSPKSKKGNAAAKGEKQLDKQENLCPMDQLGCAYLDFSPLFHSTSTTIDLCSYDGLRCQVEVTVSEALFVSPSSHQKFRPFFLSIENVDGISNTKHLTAVIKCLGQVQRVTIFRKEGFRPARVTLFFGDRPPLDIYRSILLEPATFEIYPLAQTAEENPLLIGSTSLSFRDYLTDYQTDFDEILQLLPSRSAVSNPGSQPFSASLHVKADFFTAFPRMEHVNEVGTPITNGFLTRVIINMPYKGKAVEMAITSFMKAIVQLPVCKEDVHLYRDPGESDSGTLDDVPNKQGKPKEETTDPSPETPLLYKDVLRIVTPNGVSGFEIMDDEWRTICVEGPLCELHPVVSTVISAASEDPEISVLLNSEIFVPMRFYAKFPPLVVPPQRFASLESSSTSTEEDGDTYEAEAGGTGGRIHRIKLREPLASLNAQQAFLLKRSLSDSCLRCIQKVTHLRGCTSVRQAVEHSFFPTAEEVISLERSFGQTLDLTDLFAKGEYVDVNAIEAPFLPSEDDEDSQQTPLLEDVHLDRLTLASIGRLASFNGTVSQNSSRKIPSRAVERFKKCVWMLSTEGYEVLCAFPKGTPGLTIRYHVEGQVIRCDDTLLLYVLSFHSLAKGFTDSKNPNYELTLKERKKATSHTAKTLTGRLGTKTTGRANSVLRTKETDKSSDDDDAHHPPQVDGPHPTKTMDHSLGTNAKSNQTPPRQGTLSKPSEETDYEKLWEMYESRKPKGADEPETKPPPMRF